MKIRILIILLILLNTGKSYSQSAPFALYDTAANAMLQIDSLIRVAKTQNKHVFLQVGGNWCKWCRKFNEFSNANNAIDSLFKSSYVVGHVNYSKENRNREAMERLGFPQRFGFPVFVILDQQGNRIHTQNTAYLEGPEGYDIEKVTEFLKHWTHQALDAKSYIQPPH
jgi:thioredoxin-related protein